MTWWPSDSDSLKAAETAVCSARVVSDSSAPWPFIELVWQLDVGEKTVSGSERPWSESWLCHAVTWDKLFPCPESPCPLCERLQNQLRLCTVLGRHSVFKKWAFPHNPHPSHSFSLRTFCSSECNSFKRKHFLTRLLMISKKSLGAEFKGRRTNSPL